MRRTVLVGALVLFGLAGCGGPKTAVDWDRNFSFSSLNTFDWVEQAVPRGLNDIVVNRIKSDTDEVLESKGFRRAEADPSFLVAYQYGARERHDYTGYQTGGWWRLGGGMVTLNENSWTEGTLVLDVINPANRETVWRGSAQEAVPSTGDPDPQKTMAAIQKILADFPPGGSPSSN